MPESRGQARIPWSEAGLKVKRGLEAKGTRTPETA